MEKNNTKNKYLILNNDVLKLKTQLKNYSEIGNNFNKAAAANQAIQILCNFINDFSKTKFIYN